MSEILTAEQVAELLKFSTPFVRTLAATGEIPAVKYGDDWRFVKSQVLQYLCDRALVEQRSRRFEKDNRRSYPATKEKSGPGRPRRAPIVISP